MTTTPNYQYPPQGYQPPPPQKKSKAIWWVLGVVGFVALLCVAGAVALSGTNKSERSLTHIEPGSTQGARGEALPVAPTVPTLNVGESASIKDNGGEVFATVTKAELKNGEYGGRYLIATIVIENKTPSPIDYNMFSWRIKGSDNIVYNATLNLGEKAPLSSGQLQPTQKVQGNVAFEITDAAAHGGQIGYGMFSDLAFWKVP